MYTYIVVDDESVIRKGTIAKLSALGDKLRCIGEAANGMAALALMEELAPDILITDMNMPEMDGLRFLDEVMKRWPDTPVIVISGYKDFEYARQAVMAGAVDYLLKPFSKKDIQNAAQNAIKTLEQKDESRNTTAGHAEELERAHFAADMNRLNILLLHEDSSLGELASNRLRDISASHRHVVLAVSTDRQIEDELLGRFRQECGLGDLGLYLHHPANPAIVLFILFLPQNAAVSAKKLVGQVANSLRNTLADGGFSQRLMGVSEISGELSALRERFSEVVNAMNTHMPASEGWLYYAPENEDTPKSFVWGQEEKFLFRVESGEANDVTLLTRALFSELKALPGLRLLDAKDYILHLAQRVRDFATGYVGRRSQNEEMPSSINQIVWNTIFSMEELEAYCTRFFSTIAFALKNETVYTDGDPMERMKLYIRRSYKKNLSLEILADLFYINPSYLSHIFKERTGQKLVDYINQVRIEKAKELLANTPAKMSQIAKNVGYSNDKYFFRVFKGLEGCTPEQYRNRGRE